MRASIVREAYLSQHLVTKQKHLCYQVQGPKPLLMKKQQENRSHCLSFSSLPTFDKQYDLVSKCHSYFQFRSMATSLDPKDLGNINQTQIKSFLKQKNIHFQEDFSYLILQIPSHLMTGEKVSVSWDDIDESIVPVYLNKTTGTFVSPVLGLGGDWTLMQEFIKVWNHNRYSPKKVRKLPPIPSLLPQNQDQISGMDLWNKGQNIESLTPEDFKLLLKKFKLNAKQYKLEFFVKFEAKVLMGTNDEPLQILFPVKYINNQVIGFRRLYICPHENTVKEETMAQYESKNPHHCHIMPFPHNLNVTKKSDHVVLVSSILDSLLIAGNSDVIPVALGEGVTSLPPDHLPFLHDLKVTFWFPDTGSSFDALRSFAKKIGESRCRLVTRDVPQASMMGKNFPKTDLSDFIRKNSKECHHESITTFEALRHDIFVELVSAEEVKGIRWKRLTDLNDLMQGFRRGELTIFSGRTGTGKTTFMSEYSIDLCAQNVTTLWGSFEVKNTRLAKMQLKQYSGVELEENIEQFDKWADLFQKLPMYYLTFHGSHEINKVLDAMAHAVYLYDIAHVIIDNLQFMMGTSSKGADRWLVQDEVSFNKLTPFVLAEF